ncbi:MAG: Rpn family recombination-promoting nuclease/putative transposase [Spirochaetota bacterium]
MNPKSSHDEFFKLLFREVKNAASYFQNNFPKKLLAKMDFATLKLEDGTFVDERLQEKFSDILYSSKIQGKTGYIYILLDHKSQPDKYTALQLLKYKISIWERHLDNHKTRGNLPFVFPVVLYHGAEKWRYGNNLKEIVENVEGLEIYIPDYTFALHDLSHFSDEEIKGEVVLQIGIHLLKNIYSEDLPEKLENIFELFQEIEDEKQGLKWIRAAMKYLGGSSSKKTIDKLKKVLENTEIKGTKGTKEIMATFAEELIQEGYDRGLLKGKNLTELREKRADRKRKLRTAIRLQEEGSELAFIAKIIELDTKYLETFFQRIGRF